MDKKILDVTCGARSIWFDKHHPAAVYCDKRREQYHHLWKNAGNCTLDINPDVMCDFTELPFPDKNTTANQMLFLAVVNGYFRDLGDENVLDPTYDNTAAVDVTSQRNAWIDSGKAEAVDWDDGKVIATPYKRKVFLGGDVKILGSMTDLKFVVTLM